MEYVQFFVKLFLLLATRVQQGSQSNVALHAVVQLDGALRPQLTDGRVNTCADSVSGNTNVVIFLSASYQVHSLVISAHGLPSFICRVTDNIQQVGWLCTHDVLVRMAPLENFYRCNVVQRGRIVTITFAYAVNPRICEIRVYARIDGQWGAWTRTSHCSVTCGIGVERFSRICDNPRPQLGGLRCAGDDRKTVQCANPCAVDGGWTSWVVGPCSKTCGNGKEVRTRQCRNPAPMFGGANCSGIAFVMLSCLMAACAVHGGWGSWKSSECSTTCGLGWDTKTRICDNPRPAHGGTTCAGYRARTVPCKLRLCKIIPPKAIGVIIVIVLIALINVGLVCICMARLLKKVDMEDLVSRLREKLGYYYYYDSSDDEDEEKEEEEEQEVQIKEERAGERKDVPVVTVTKPSVDTIVSIKKIPDIVVTVPEEEKQLRRKRKKRATPEQQRPIQEKPTLSKKQVKSSADKREEEREEVEKKKKKKEKAEEKKAEEKKEEEEVGRPIQKDAPIPVVTVTKPSVKTMISTKKKADVIVTTTPEELTQEKKAVSKKPVKRLPLKKILKRKISMLKTKRTPPSVSPKMHPVKKTPSSSSTKKLTPSPSPRRRRVKKRRNRKTAPR